MGACASSAKRVSSSRSSRKLRASIVHSETHKHSDTTTIAVMDKPHNVIDVAIDHPPFKSVSSFSNHGSKEEAFFDSQAWLESDCDDEFYSVNGDFTPSRGSTPLYRSIPGTPINTNLSSRVNRALFEGKSPPYYTTEPNRSSHGSTPLHRSASAAAPRVDSDGVMTAKSPPTEKIKRKKLGELFRESISEDRMVEESDNSDGYISGTKSRAKRVEEKVKHIMKPAQCCFPRLPSARGLKKTMAPAPAIFVDA